MADQLRLFPEVEEEEPFVLRPYTGNIYHIIARYGRREFYITCFGDKRKADLYVNRMSATHDRNWHYYVKDVGKHQRLA